MAPPPSVSSTSTVPSPAANGFCVACGSRNVVEHSSSHHAVPHVRCRGCGVISPDFSQRKQRRRQQHTVSTLDKATAQSMADQVIDALAQPSVRKQLHDALKAAHGDVVLLCHKYLPTALAAFARVVSAFGFPDSIDGVIESVQALQELARGDEEMVERLIVIRRALTPTGAWIREDQEAEQAEERRAEAELKAAQQREQDKILAAEVAARNAKLARIRARKLALGLDPLVPRLPVFDVLPPPLVVATEGSKVRLRVAARFTLKCQWFFNGRSLDDDGGEDEAALRRGVQRNVLVLPRLTKRVAGEYHCICENDEGSSVTPVTRVVIATLQAPRLNQRKLPALVRSSTLVGGRALAVCSGTNTVALYAAESMAPIRVVPPLPTDCQMAAWSLHTQKLAVVTRELQPSESKSTAALGHKVTMYSIDLPPPPPPIGPAPQDKQKLAKAASSASLTPNARSEKAETLDIIGLKRVCAIAFVCKGGVLVISDLDRCVQVYSISGSEFSLLRTITTENDRILHLAASSEAQQLVLTFRDRPFVDVVSVSPPDSVRRSIPAATGTRSSAETNRLHFAFPVHLAELDHFGFFAAVAESGCLKSWISIVNVRTKQASQQRFVAHVGKVSGLQWTETSSLLLSSGHDGFVRVWDPVAASALLEVHIDSRGVHEMVFVRATSTIITQGYSTRSLETREVQFIKDLEAFRAIQQSEAAVQVQRMWKGRRTRKVIATYLKTGGDASSRRRRSSGHTQYK